MKTVNFHLTKACNMSCSYCFARFNKVEKKLNLEQQKRIISLLRKGGFDKINFVGGEPLLEKNIIELIKYAKQVGFYTSVVTNGSLLNENFLNEIYSSLDMIGISIDSLQKFTNNKIGRKTNSRVMQKKDYIKICSLIKKYEIGLKINTVVSRYNYMENLSDFILLVQPEKWKIFQALEVKGENDLTFDAVTPKEFQKFITINNAINSFMYIEDNNLMRGTYFMVNPEGCFFDNMKGGYTVSSSILKIGVNRALSEINIDFEKYLQRQQTNIAV